MPISLSGSLVLTGSLTTTSTITAQTLVVQTITSSISSITGSTNFGTLSSNTHTFTGSLNVTGALAVVTTGTEFQVNSTGVNLGNALTDSHVISGSLRVNPSGLFVSSSGNVGIGTITPSQKLEIVGGEIKAGRVDSSNEGGQLSFGRASDNNTAWYIDAYGSSTSPQLRFVNVDNAVVAMTITGSNVGIGTSSPRGAGGSYTGMEIYGASGASLLLTNGGGNVSFFYTAASGGDLLIENSGAQIFRAGSSERMRITSGGQVAIANSGGGLDTARLYVLGSGATAGEFGVTGTSGTLIRFSNGQSVGGSITIAAGGGTSYNTSSDYRLKEDLKEINGLEKISAIKVYDFKWKICDERMYGVLAHELQEVLPFAVNGEKDGNQMQGVDYSLLVPVLVKAIQELEARLKTLENK